jgi:arginyl-tRNA synthetase
VLAIRWAGELKRNLPPWISSIETQKAYINFRFDRTVYAAHVVAAMKDPAAVGASWAAPDLKGQSVVVEFSSPNMAKPIGIHHIRSTVIGNCIANLFEFVGSQVQRLNYIGDYGTTFGQLCYAFTKWGSREKLDSEAIHHLLEIYVKFNQELEKDPSLQEKGKEWFARLENKEPEARKLWELFRKVSEREFQKIYGRMGIRFTEMTGEAHYAERIEEALAHIKKFVKIEESDGAQVVFLEGFKTPLLIRKSDGTTLYSTRDIAAALDRVKRFHPHTMLYVVAIQQKLHFQQLFALLKKTDFPKDTNIEHVAFGMLSFKEGTMSTRKGKIIFLEHVLETATQKALEIINEKNPDCAEKEHVAEAVGIGAVIFNDLKSKRERDVVFSWEEALNFEGDSGPYVQYIHARTCALFEKNGRPSTDKLPAKAVFGEEAFRLAWNLSLFPYAVERAVSEREPYHVAQFLLNVCGAFNAFYAHVKIREMDADAKEAHLQLVDCTSRVLKLGLHLLGLKAPERI